MNRRSPASTRSVCVVFAALASSTLSTTHQQDVLRITVQKTAEGLWVAAAESGVRFGVSEAAHTAGLLGRHVELDARATTDQSTVVIGANTISIAAGEDPACQFRIDPSFERRQRAVAVWNAQSDGAAATADAALEALAWHPQLSRFGADELNERFRRATGGRMTSPEWLGWVAVKALAEAFLRAEPGTALCGSLRSVRFDGHKGRPIRFDGARELQQTLVIARDGKMLAEVDPWAEHDR